MARNLTTGRSAFLALLKDEGITHLFGNPGTTELPVMDALKDHPEVTYVMVDARAFTKVAIPEAIRALLERGAPGVTVNQAG